MKRRGGLRVFSVAGPARWTPDDVAATIRAAALREARDVAEFGAGPAAR